MLSVYKGIPMQFSFLGINKLVIIQFVLIIYLNSREQDNIV